MSLSPGHSAESARVVVAATLPLITAIAKRTRLPFADNTWSPIPELTLEAIARAFGCVLQFADLGPRTLELGVPGYYGPPVLILNSMLSAPERRLAMRHGLGHLVAGELEPGQGGEVRYMSDMLNFMALEERRSDLFACADLWPDRVIDDLVRAGYTLDERIHWLWCGLKTFAPKWPTARIADRVGLRLALYQESSHA